MKLSESSQQVAHVAPTELAKPSRPPVRCVSGSVALASSKLAYAATVVGQTLARKSPTSKTVVARLGPLDINGLPTVLGVTAIENRGCVPAWYRVELPVLPNGTTGWVPARAVRIHRVTSRIVIDLSKRILRVYRSGRLLLQTTVGVGAPKTPTPVGRFFVDERYALSSAGGPFGPAALGISAHSVALEHSWVENGPIALHGTNEPWSIGEAASHGCIHIANDVMRRLFPLAPDGTPVIIDA